MVTYIRFALSSEREFIRELTDSSFGREFNDSFARELSVQLWCFNQRTTEAEEVTDS
jgi:hypothetical protein